MCNDVPDSPTPPGAVDSNKTSKIVSFEILVLLWTEIAIPLLDMNWIVKLVAFVVASAVLASAMMMLPIKGNMRKRAASVAAFAFSMLISVPTIIHQWQKDHQGYDSEHWAALTPDQIKEWEGELSPYKLKTMEISWSGNKQAEATGLYASLTEIGEKAGFSTSWSVSFFNDGYIHIRMNPYDPEGDALQSLFGLLYPKIRIDDDASLKPGNIAVNLPSL